MTEVFKPTKSTKSKRQSTSRSTKNTATSTPEESAAVRRNGFPTAPIGAEKDVEGDIPCSIYVVRLPLKKFLAFFEKAKVPTIHLDVFQNQCSHQFPQIAQFPFSLIYIYICMYSYKLNKYTFYICRLYTCIYIYI